ncbi:hypothetical protein SNOG_05705 [Parastagonospora nodorum SN15]|uniref:Metallo-beta-lactamase domain-containing protein n=1 Tax=Phaeosphaeria nodorum (strain SN15 / ATCC MYA-4574 / FGSC 10173) TaxID=321614 RepID=Q0URA9_PHANO|nr:hypothetical protein SNOG_05705 [Parastagonospora nodorum SN15]EAT86769.1 hypothetical protein SNOG_05705 [Parastagonospora nodorum SN15]
MSMTEDAVVLPKPRTDQRYVTISALQAGHLTLPEKLFVTEADPEKRATVPSLSFLIQHPSNTISSTTSTLVFDLGLKRDLSGYRKAQQQHIAQRQPTTVSPDAAESLRKGGLDPEDIDTVMLSHVHWDHVGTPSDFPNSEFVVGSGTMHLLAHGGGPLYPAEIFNPDELPNASTRELPPARDEDAWKAFHRQTTHTWKPLAGFPAAIDFFDDGSLILSGEKGIALYDDGRGGLRSVHADTDEAARTVERAARLLKKGVVREEGGGEVDVEVVVAHDRGWAEGNAERFWPGRL